MSIKIKQNSPPPLKMPSFKCDYKLHKKLDDYELTSLLNKSNFTLFLGRPASGKTSLALSLLDTPQLFKRCFHKIYVFMPSHSRASLHNNIFEQLPHEQLYDTLDAENIDDVFDNIEQNSDEGMSSLIIMDDVQVNLKDKYVSKRLLEIVANRRHLKTSVWLLAQTYKSIPRQVRQVITNLFVFKVSKGEMENIFNEQIELFKDHFQTILSTAYREPHNYLFIDTATQRIFKNFDEIILDEDSDYD